MGYDGHDHWRPDRPDRFRYPEWEPDPQWRHPPPPDEGERASVPLRFRILLLGPLALLLAATAAVGALFIYYTVVFPDPLAMRPKATGPVIRIMARDGSPLAERGVSRAYIPLDMLPPHAAEAVVAIEDRRFFEHPGIDALGILTFVILLSLIHGRQLPLARKAATLDSLKEGLRFMRDTKVILAAITLDMFAVLFGGAVALLPIYATDILHVGAEEVE